MRLRENTSRDLHVLTTPGIACERKISRVITIFPREYAMKMALGKKKHVIALHSAMLTLVRAELSEEN